MAEQARWWKGVCVGAAQREMPLRRRGSAGDVHVLRHRAWELRSWHVTRVRWAAACGYWNVHVSLAKKYIAEHLDYVSKRYCFALERTEL